MLTFMIRGNECELVGGYRARHATAQVAPALDNCYLQ
jgi:hypothetical protein